jgi:asparagine synthase (glutamine-hydrolysing)
MCGICGQFRFDGEIVSIKSLEDMMSKLVRRGPDSNGTWLEGKVGFGHQRLSVIDLSLSGSQPMVDELLKLSLVFNGTIYNYKALRDELIGKGYSFFSSSDTEVVIKAYHCWGETCVHHLDGMFAFAIWDKSSEELFVARDRMGIKPLYYSLTPKMFTFASNSQALLTQELDRSINPVALHYQLSLHGVVPAPNTIIKGIQKLKPGTVVKINAQGKFKEIRYWHPSAIRAEGNISEKDYIERAHQLLIAAVTKRMAASDVPIGVLLSGGLDSSLIVALLKRAGHKSIRTFSIGFEDIDNESGKEFEYSDQIASVFNTQHKKYRISNKKVLERLSEAVMHMAEPMVSQDAVAFYLLSEQVSKHTKVVLSGQGADEAFAGYFWYPRMLEESGDDIERFSKHYVDRPHDEYLQTVMPVYQGENHTHKWLNKEFLKPGANSFMDKVFRLDMTRLIVDDPVKRVDNMTMAWGLETRVPFMDTELVEWALNIPASLKMKDDGKYPLKQIARGLLPNSVIDRKKGYFPMPALKYIQGDFLEFMSDILSSTACRNRGVFDQQYINNVINSPQDYMTALNGSRLWHLALLELWIQINVDRG